MGTAKGYWDDRAGQYDADTAFVVGRDLLDSMKAALVEALPPGEVIELGCGPGAFTKAYAARDARVIATDFAPHMVEAASRALAAFPNVSCRVADAASTGLPDCSANAVVVMNLIHIVPDPAAVVAEAQRLLRPGGALVVSSYSKDGLGLVRTAAMGVRALVRFGPGLLRNRTDFTQARLEALVRAAGFGDLKGRLIAGRAANAVFVRAVRAGGEPAGAP